MLYCWLNADFKRSFIGLLTMRRGSRQDHWRSLAGSAMSSVIAATLAYFKRLSTVSIFLRALVVGIVVLFVWDVIVAGRKKVKGNSQEPCR